MLAGRILVGVLSVFLVVRFRSADTAHMSVLTYFLLVLVVGSIASDFVLAGLKYGLGNLMRRIPQRFGPRADQRLFARRFHQQTAAHGRQTRDEDASSDYYNRNPLVTTEIRRRLLALVTFVAASAFLVPMSIEDVSKWGKGAIMVASVFLLFALALYLPLGAAISAAGAVTRYRLWLRGLKYVTKIGLEGTSGWPSMIAGIAVFMLSCYLEYISLHQAALI